MNEKLILHEAFRSHIRSCLFWVLFIDIQQSEQNFLTKSSVNIFGYKGVRILALS